MSSDNEINTALNLINRTLQHISGCVLKNDEAAALSETEASREMFNLLYRVIKGGTSVSSTLLSGFVETNPYYIEFLAKDGYCDAGGEILVSSAIYAARVYTMRTSSNYSLLYQPTGILNDEEKIRFTNLWAESVSYYWDYVHSEALEYYPDLEVASKILIICRVLLRMMNYGCQVEDIRNLKTMTDTQIGQYILSWDMSLIADITNDQRREIAKSLIYLITNKGSQAAINRIMEVLDYKEVDLYWYLLVFNGNYDQAFDADGYPTETPLVRTPYFVEIPYQSNADTWMLENAASIELIPYNEIVSEDDYWQATEEEIKSLPVQSIGTKYLGARSTLYSDRMEQYGMLFWWLEKFRMDETLVGSSEFGVTNSTYSSKPFFVGDFFLAIGVLKKRLLGLVDINVTSETGMMFSENLPPDGYWNPVTQDIPKPGRTRRPGANDIWRRGDFPANPGASSVMTAFIENQTFLDNCVDRLLTIPKVNVEYRYLRRFRFCMAEFYDEIRYPSAGGSTGLEDYLELVNVQLHSYLKDITSEDAINSMIFTLKSEVLTWVNQYSPAAVVCFAAELKKRMPAVALFHLINSHTVHFMGVDQRIVCNNTATVMDFMVFNYSIYPEDVIGYVEDDVRWTQYLQLEGDGVLVYDEALLAKTWLLDEYLAAYDECSLKYDLYDRNDLKLIDGVRWLATITPGASQSVMIYDSCFFQYQANTEEQISLGETVQFVPVFPLWNETSMELDTFLDEENDTWLDSEDAYFTGGDASYNE